MQYKLSDCTWSKYWGWVNILSAEFTSRAVTAGLASGTGSVYFLKDALGSVTDIMNGSGNIIQSYQYSSFGKIATIKNSSGVDVTSNAPIKTSFTFTGREFDQETGLYYYRARYYDANIGRFLQSDPSAGYITQPLSVVNKYIYAINNPIVFSDPSGRDVWDELGRALTIVAAVVVAVYAGAAIAAYLGVSGTLTGILVGSFAGALAGGAIGAIGFSLSHSDPQEGFRIGAALGFFAGGFGGFYAKNFVNIKPFGGIKSIEVHNFARDQLSGAASRYKGGSELITAAAKYSNSSSWPIWSILAGYANAALPYVVAVGEAGAIGYLDQCTGARDCSGLLPNHGTVNWNLEF